MDVVDNLMNIEKQLTTWLFMATPQTQQEQATMTQVLALRDTLFETVNKIVLKRLQIAALNLSDMPNEMSAISSQMESTAKNIGTASDVIKYVSSAIKVAASILSLIL